MNGSPVSRHFWILILMVMCLSPCLASSQIRFEKTYGGVDTDAALCVQQTQDGGYIIGGGTWSFGAGLADVYFVRTDSLGDTLWTKTYGGSQYDGCLSVQQTPDGGYIAAGYTSSFGAGFEDIYLIKLDSLGDTMWTETYGGDGDERGLCVQEAWNGGYIVTGWTSSFGAGLEDIYLVRLDSLGDTVWTRTYGGSGGDKSACVRQTQDAGFVITGYTDSFGVGSLDVYLVKTDSTGDTIWTRTYGGVSYDLAYSVEQTLDGGYIIAGRTSSFGSGLYDTYLIRTDSLGDTVWIKTYGGSDHDAGYAVQQTQDGGYMIAGFTASFDASVVDVYLVRADTLGDTLWTRTFGGVAVDFCNHAQQTADRGYVIAGYTYSFGAGDCDIYLIKTDENGLTGVDESSSGDRTPVSGVRLVQNSPNPFHRSTIISYSLPRATQVTLSIYDITGRLVETLVNETQQPGIHQVRWDRKSNPSGVYFYSLRTGKFLSTRKMVVVE